MNPTVASGQLVYPSDFSCFPPNVPTELIKRETMLSTIDLAFSNGEKAILISGDDGMGKTVLLSQFQDINKSNCISLFIDVTNKQSYFEQNLLRDLYSQIYFMVNSKECPTTEMVDQTQFQSMLYTLQLALRKTEKSIYMLIDGLDDIPTEDDYIVESLMQSLPLSDLRIKFIFSTKSKALEKFLSNIRFKTIEMMLYSYEESQVILNNLSADEVKEVLAVYRGIPERIDLVKRLLENGTTLNEIIQQYSTNNQSLLVAEWDSIGELDDKSRRILAVIAFSERALSIADLSSIFECSDEELNLRVDKISFVGSQSNSLKFISTAMKEFTREKLTDLKFESLRKIITYWGSRPVSANTISEITSYSHVIGDYLSVVEQLTNSNILTIFNETHSVNGLSRQVKNGLNAATKIESEIEVFRFSHLHSFMAGLKTSKLLESELICHLNQGDYDAAMGLATASKVLEEQLHLLSTIATHQKNKNDSVDPSLEKKILEYFDEINPEYLGVDRTVDLASKLFTAFPEQALSLINRIDSLGRGGENKADYAFFRFSLEALKNNLNAVDKLLEGIESKEEKKHKALNMLGLFKKGTPPKKIIDGISDFDHPGDAIYILKSWINAFPDSEGVFLLVEKLISLVITTTDYHANASLFADLSSSLGHMSKKEGTVVLEKVLPRLTDLQSSGPTIDFVELQCNILKFEIEHYKDSSRAEELLTFISKIPDVSIKLASLTLLNREFEEQKNIFDLGYINGLKESIYKQIVSDTADQYVALKDPLFYELQVSYKNAIRWAKGLNNLNAIDRALTMLIHEACELELNLNIRDVVQNIRDIKDKDYKADSAIAFFEYLSKNEHSVSRAELDKLIRLRNRFKDNLVITQLNTCLLQIMKKRGFQLEDKRSLIIKSLEEAWQGLDGSWQKIDVAFKIHNKLYQSESGVATEFKGKAIELRKSENAVSADDMFAQGYSIDLAVRCFYFLCTQNLESDSDLQRICSLIRILPGKQIRIRLFSRLASAFHLTRKIDQFHSIVEQTLLPELDELGNDYSHDLASAMVISGPIIFTYSKEIFDKKLEVIYEDRERHDTTLFVTHKYLLTKTLIHDPYRPVKKHKYKISAADLSSHLSLVKKIRNDALLYKVLEKIVKIVSLGKKNSTFSKAQLLDLETELEKINQSCFMKDGDIQHEGYKLCTEALKLNIKGEKALSEWERLVVRAHQLPVHSDKVIVIGEIIEYMPSSLNERKKTLLTEAVQIVYDIDSNLEKISRFEYLAEQGMDLDKPQVKNFIKDAILLSTSEDTEEFHDKRLNLIDSLDSMDKEFARGLSALYDNDPARKKIIQENIKAKQKEQETRDNFTIASDEIIKNSTSSKYPSLMWELLGKLNAENHIPEKKADFLKYLSSVAEYKPVDAYPMLSYYIHANNNSAPNKQAISKIYRPILEVLLTDSELFAALLETQFHFPSKINSDGSQLVFGENDGEAVIDFFSDWISKNQSTDIIIVDPYFTHEDLEFIGTVIKKDPNYSIRILTSYSNIKKIQKNSGEDLADIMRIFWEENITTEAVPDIDVIFCGLPSMRDTMPIHDRWWITADIGLRLGGSINGLMGKRVSEVSEMQHDEVLAVEQKIMGYVDNSQRKFNGEKLKYTRVSI